ncbi:MAG: hypothetical protein IH597_00470 [Bacteroidales bacterium]|nr:hypothetical protein [Bacteroidales bacterium]
MTEKNGHTSFEKGFRESFGDFMQSPDPAVWSRIEAGLQRKKRIILFARFAAAASLLLLFSVTGWLVFRTSDPALLHPSGVSHQSENATPETSTQLVPETTIAEKTPSIIKETKEKVSGSDRTKEPSKLKPEVSREKSSDPSLAEINEPTPKPEPPVDDYTGDLTITDPIEIAVQSEPVVAEQKLPALEEVERLLATEEFLPEKPEEKKWQLALGYGTIQGQAVTDASEAYDNLDANFGGDPFSAKLSTETRDFSSVENTVHSQPITFGLLIHRSFSENWGMESGLLYTKLKSSSRTNLQNDEYTLYSSEVNYIGLPVSIRLNMIQGQRFGMYISQGAVIEKAIRVRYTTNMFVSEVLKSTEQGIYMAEGVQVSSLTAIGFEYRLSKLLSLYAQPGLQVFFLNQTQPYNIRSSSAIWPSLQTGLKFQL